MRLSQTPSIPLNRIIGTTVSLLAVFAPHQDVPGIAVGSDHDHFSRSITHMMDIDGPQGYPSVCEALLLGQVYPCHLDSVRLQDAWDFCEATRRPRDGVWKVVCTMPEDSSTWECPRVSSPLSGLPWLSLLTC